MKRTIALYVAALALASVSVSVFVFASADDDTGFEPARFLSGDLVPPPALAIGGGEVLLQLDVDSTGSVARVDVLRSVASTRVVRSAAGLDEAATDAVRRWTFRPAERNGRAIRFFAYAVIGFREPVTSTR